MKSIRLAIVLTGLNLLILLFNLAQTQRTTASDVAPVLRGRALEIVDDKGNVRASIGIFPADPKVKMPDGTTGYPETVLLRLRDSKGRPNVKIQATELGGAIGFGGEDDPTYASLGAQRAATSLKLKDRNGRERIITP